MWMHLWRGHRKAKKRDTPTKTITEKGPRSLLLSLISLAFWHYRDSAGTNRKHANEKNAYFYRKQKSPQPLKGERGKKNNLGTV